MRSLCGSTVKTNVRVFEINVRTFEINIRAFKINAWAFETDNYRLNIAFRQLLRPSRAVIGKAVWMEKFLVAELLLPSIGSPHHFAAQSVEKSVIETLCYFDAVICTADGQLSCLFARFASPVNSNKEIMTAAFYV